MLRHFITRLCGLTGILFFSISWAQETTSSNAIIFSKPANFIERNSLDQNQVEQNATEPISSHNNNSLQKNIRPIPITRTISAFPSIQKTRIAVLLPTRVAQWQKAAQAVYAGILTAAAQMPKDIVLSLIETTDNPQEVAQAYQTLQNQADIIIGPLTRASVGEVIRQNATIKTTIALSQPENTTNTPIFLSAKMVIIGLSIEEEARQVASWMIEEGINKTVLSLATATPWQQRAVRAFNEYWQQLGGKVIAIEIPVTGGSALVESLQQLPDLIATEFPAAMFIALDATQAEGLNSVLQNTKNLPLYGTSQINALPPNFQMETQPIASVSFTKGIKFLDIPWQLEPRHTAVEMYQERRTLTTKPYPKADRERLFALGIDAFRIAQEFIKASEQNTMFEIDGVTGNLTVTLTPNATLFQREYAPAVLHNHQVFPIIR